MVEVTGFAVMVVGMGLTVVGLLTCCTAKELPCGGSESAIFDWIESRLKVHWVIQILLTAVCGPLLMMIGGGVYCIGNGGRYPGFPLDVILRWFNGG